MPPLVLDVMEAHRAALLRADEAAMRLMAQRWLQVEAQLQAQIDALTLELAARQGPVTMGQLTRMRRYVALQNQVADQLDGYASFVESNITRRQMDAGLQALEQSSLSINATAADAGIQIQFDRLPASSVERMVGLAGDGSPLRTVLTDAGRQGADALANELVRGMALGLNPREIARRAMRQGLASSFTRMVTISRTEVNRVARQTTQDSYQHSRVVRAYRRLAAHSSRTCVACLALDGRTYPLGTPFEEHVNGRCTMIPVLTTGTPIQFQTGPQWFAQQPESVQRSMMGPGRWDLWQQGRITWDDLVTIHESERWGNSPQVTPLSVLVSR
jgi:SPP1 gp7 family putative phage head morphogenesis protein